MNQSAIVAPYLREVAEELRAAEEHLGATWVSSDSDSIARLTAASEAIVRAVAQIASATERLAELVLDP